MSNIFFEPSTYKQNDIGCRIFVNYSPIEHDYASNWHYEAEFLYIVSGTATIYIENDTYIAHAGDIVTINTSKIHTISGDDWQLHCIVPSESFFQKLEIQRLDYQLPTVIRDEELAKCFLKIIEEQDNNRFFSRQFKSMAIQQFLLLVFEKHGNYRFTNQPSVKNNDFIISVKVINYLQQHLPESFSLDSIAEEIGISTSYMSHCVKSATGIGIIEHLNRLRCYTAKHYLLHSNKKINEIATLCGYQNNSYFARTYQKIIGCSPNETQRNIQAAGD